MTLTLTEKAENLVHTAIQEVSVSGDTDKKVEGALFDIWIRSEKSNVFKERQIKDGDILKSETIGDSTYHVCTF